jgi:SatD family protein
MCFRIRKRRYVLHVNGMKDAPPVAALIGDLVGSRTATDRERLHRTLAAALDATNAELEPLGALRIIAGDEFQATYVHLGTALRAAWRLRWALAGETDLRFGVGWGHVRVLDAETGVEDGPGWWAARAAVEWAEDQAARPGTRHLRTAYRRADGVAGPDPGPVNAALVCRDHMVGSLSERSRRILGRLVAGEPQAAIADDEGISASAVSQRVRGDGLAVVVAAQELLEEMS